MEGDKRKEISGLRKKNLGYINFKSMERRILKLDGKKCRRRIMRE